MVRTPELDVHIHVFSPNSPEFKRHVVFRDWLRNHADDWQAYESIKRDLSAQSWDDMNAYAQAKSEVVERILSLAFQDQANAFGSEGF